MRVSYTVYWSKKYLVILFPKIEESEKNDVQLSIHFDFLFEFS